MKRVFLLLLAVAAVACKSSVNQEQSAPPVIANTAMVVSAHPVASQVGVDILRKGGNAVDAAVATQLALAVVFPAAGNVGGGGFMVYRQADGKISTLDYREKAPGQATTNMYLDENQNVIQGLSEQTHLASGVPGTVAGIWEAHQKHGKLPWTMLVQPAIDLAQHGFALTEKEASGLNSIQQELKNNNTILPEYLIRDKWSAGDTVVLQDLGKTLERIRDQGPKGFYEGTTAEFIIAEMKRGNGLISAEDLKAYRTHWREPVTGMYKGYKIISMGPPSSGGIGLLQMLKSVERFPLKSWGHNSEKTIHLYTEVQRRAYADRAFYLGDPEFVSIPVDELISAEYNQKRMSTFSEERATPSREVGEGKVLTKESDQTTHLSIVDSEGNAVAVTTTLNDSYGNKIVVAGAGFLLNNEMDDFSAKPGYANMFGAIGGEANKILPGKTMLSSMTPTIVERDNKLFMVVGTPGGTTIITSVFQTILNVIEFDMNMQQAVTAPRVHSQWMPDLIVMEANALSPDVVKALEAKGHQIDVRRDGIGQVDAILVREDGKLEGGADPRGDNTALGY